MPRATRPCFAVSLDVRLAEAKANLNVLNRKGRAWRLGAAWAAGQSAIHTASHAGLDEVARWLTEHASPGLINVQDKHGRTAWYCASRAAESGNTETLKVLKVGL